MLLPYLNEEVFMPEVGMNTVVSGLTNYVDEMITGSESSNFEIARKLETAKLNLIDALAKFSVTTSWILNKYQRDIKTFSTDEAIDTQKNLKKHDLIASQSLSEDSNELFSSLPFSFEDLVEMTDLVVYTFQTRGFCYQANNFPLKNPADWIVKRLKRLKRLNASTLADKLKVLPDNDERFLSDELLYQYVIGTVFAEFVWLNTRQRLVENNTKLVLYIANQYKGGFLDFDDLVQEGQTGLLAAVDKFDYHLGCQFSTYAAYWIRQRISRALSRNERVVRVPCEQVGNIGKLFRAKEEWLAKTGKNPSLEELADYLNMSRDEINSILSIAQTALPLENFDDDSDDEMSAPIDMIEQQVFQPALNEMAQSELENWLELAIKTLNSRESKVICCHFGIDTDSEMTLQEIGAELNISRERVRQIQVTAFNKMKLNYGEQLVSFL